MASSVGSRYWVETRKATNAAMTIRSVGFKPRKVKVFNLTNAASLEWNSGMAAAAGFKTVTAGTQTYETSDGITAVVADSNGNPGFTLGAMADVNDTTTEDLVLEAWE